MVETDDVGAPDTHERPAPPAPRFDAFELVAYAVALVAVVAQCAAPWAPPGRLWGADALAFLPRLSLGLGLVAAAAVALLATRFATRGAAREGRPPAWVIGVAAMVAGVAFWTFRIRHVLLGDGIPITHVMPDAHGIHPREPLASMFVESLYRTLAPVFGRPGMPRAQVVQDCVAAGSVFAGVLFVLAAAWLAHELVRGFPARAPEREGRVAGLLALAMLAQGYVQIFFGYVEIYALPIVVATLYVAAALRYLRGACALHVPLTLAALGVAFAFTGVVLGPSAIVLAGAGLADPARRRSAARDLALMFAIVAGVLAWLALGPVRYDAWSNLAAMLASARAETAYLLSRAHVRDWANAQVLLGPFGLVLALPALAALPAKRGRPRAMVLFLAAAVLAIAWACWSTPDLPMGYARDWDLFSPLAVVLTASALGLTLALVRRPTARSRVLAVIVATSLFHTVPWVALNTSAARSLARFATLPLDGGRRETTIAFWHAEHDDMPKARAWLKRALALNPGNVRALDLSGRIALRSRDPRLAVRAYLIAVTLRPDKADYRGQLAYSLAAAGGPLAGLEVLDSLMAGHENHGALWLERAMLLRAAGLKTQADSARARALSLVPELAAFSDSLPALPPPPGIAAPN